MQKTIEPFLKNAGIAINGSNPYDIQIKDKHFFDRLKPDLSLSIGEAYMDGLWDCEALDELFFRVFRANNNLEDVYRKWPALIRLVGNQLFNQQSKGRSLRVAEKHYNLGNDLYEAMLGPSMAYTCAYWKESQTLDEAQQAKYRLICQKLELKKGDRVLDLGCGFGGFSRFAAENYGCEVVAVNISDQQVAFARQINKHLPVTIFHCDYRDAHLYNSGNIPFDKVACIGLCEHVGKKNYSALMKIVRQQLNETGLFLLHTIGKNRTTNFSDTWINKYIFPGGMLPSLVHLTQAMEGSFILEDLHNFGCDYSRTLISWYQNFNQNWDRLKDTYSEHFYRMWKYYLLSCAGAFRSRRLQLWQFVLSPKGVPEGYASIR